MELEEEDREWILGGNFDTLFPPTGRSPAAREATR
jgi:hypothetical protein